MKEFVEVVVEVFVAVVMEVFVGVVTETFVPVVTESVDDGVAVAVFVVPGDPVSVVVPGGSVPVADAVGLVEPVVSPLGDSPDDPDSVPVASGGSVVDSGGVRVGVGLSLGVAAGPAVEVGLPVGVVVVGRSAVPEAFDVPPSAPVAPTGCSTSDTASSGTTGVPPKTAHPMNGAATNTRANTMTCDGLRSPGCIPAPPAPPVIVIRSASPRLAR